jgi:hypothetical protein
MYEAGHSDGATAVVARAGEHGASQFTMANHWSATSVKPRDYLIYRFGGSGATFRSTLLAPTPAQITMSADHMRSTQVIFCHLRWEPSRRS